MSTATRADRMDELIAAWSAAWPAALEAWSKFTRIRPPTLCRSDKEAKAEGLTGSFAMIRLHDQAIIVSLPQVIRSGVEDLPVEILAHEIGHHVLAPSTLTDHGRMIARMRWALPTVERHAPMIANMYTDILINDRLQRTAGLRMGEVYRAMGGEAKGDKGQLWSVYVRIFEVLWSLPRGSLGGHPTQGEAEGDAWLGARLVRSYARDWLAGSGRFAALVLPYLLADAGAEKSFAQLLDTRGAGAGGEPSGLAEMDPDEADGALHPAMDPRLNGEEDGEPEPTEAPPVDSDRQAPPAGQMREPFQYGEILRAAGIDIDDHEAAVRYYAERARKHLVKFPSRRAPEAPDPIPEGLEPWTLGDPLDELSWFETIGVSPRVVPGMTTVKRVIGTSEGRETRPVPVDLDIYVDSSGSMANPQQQTSYPALAGAIIAVSALRAGARVQVTLWSGTRQFISTPGFVRDEHAILRVLTGYFGGATAFPIHVLRDTMAARRPDARPVHVLIVSDDGVTTMYDTDERGQDGFDVCGAALARAGGGGTMVLNLPDGWEKFAPNGGVARARDQQGWRVDVV
ncbi:MAG TPA: VWA domain-containing protein, partial [Kofleriaceae bacterium]|nr:VWA domain-containing protein [Kofleriaceae bacterium]